MRNNCVRYVLLVLRGTGYPQQKEQGDNRERLCLSKHQNLIIQLSYKGFIQAGRWKTKEIWSPSLVGYVAVLSEVQNQASWEMEERQVQKRQRETVWSNRETRSLFCSKSDCYIVTDEWGIQWFQAADGRPTGSILTFSLVIDELAGWGQGLALSVSQAAFAVMAGGHLL